MKKIIYGIFALAFVFTVSLSLNAQDVPKKQKAETKTECKSACDKKAKADCKTEAKADCKTEAKADCKTEAKKECGTKETAAKK